MKFAERFIPYVYKGSFLLSSGEHSGIFIDVKSALTKRENIVATAGRIRWHLFPKHKIAGIETGSAMLAAVVAYMHGTDYVIVRKNNSIIGTIGLRDRFVLLEDVTTTGNNVIRAWEALASEGAIPEKIIIVLDREQNAIKRIRRKLLLEKGTVVSLLKLSDLEEAAMEVRS